MALNWLRRIGANGEETCCCPECDAQVEPETTHCTSCGYDIVTQAKADLGRPPGQGAG
jgi:hypothetical protein